MRCAIAVAAALSMVIVISSARAEDFPFRTGTFYGQFCDGNQVRYDVTSQNGITFYGHILNSDQYDPLTIVQNSDYSLTVVRWLQGEHNGLTQGFNSFPPAQRVIDGVLKVQFYSPAGWGPYCGHAADIRM